MSSPPPPPAGAVPPPKTTSALGYIPYLNLLAYSIAALSSLFSILLMSRLICYAHFRTDRLRVKSLSSSLYFYLLCHCTFCALTLPYLVYMVAWWTPPHRPPPVTIPT